MRNRKAQHDISRKLEILNYDSTKLVETLADKSNATENDITDMEIFEYEK